MSSLRLTASFLFAALLIAGCDLTKGDDDENDDLTELEGMWSASTFLLATEEETYDIIEEGGDIEMTLHEDGTVTDGLLTAPCSIPGTCEDVEEGDFEVTFEGSFDRDGQLIRFDHDADTFIRSVDWTFNGTTLTASTLNLNVALTRE